MNDKSNRFTSEMTAWWIPWQLPDPYWKTTGCSDSKVNVLKCSSDLDFEFWVLSSGNLCLINHLRLMLPSQFQIKSLILGWLHRIELINKTLVNDDFSDLFFEFSIYVFMLKVICFENFSFQSYQNKDFWVWTKLQILLMSDVL